MYMINVNAFIKREEAMRDGKEDCGTNVLEFRDDEATDYAILSHRWIGKEVDYKEMIKLARMNKSDQKAIRNRDGYKKILSSCEQAKRDGYSWLWVDTCCIDKRSSAELSEAINSMYRWYANAKVCYAYLHDVTSTSFPTEVDDEKYPNSNGWPEWFSRGWTLQEMIAPSNVQFFNKDWKFISDKKMLARILTRITRVPEHILRDGLSSNRPCVAQIMSWAANRKTTRVEDRAYSLLGLLDVNMPMLYGEGKKAFQRLQLEIIRTSNDQSIFAWDKGRTGSILADDPSFFENCEQMELMDHYRFIESLKRATRGAELPYMDKDQFDVFPITNRGIQIWMFLSPLKDSESVFQAWLPCRFNPFNPPVTITLALWNSNFYRYNALEWASGKTVRICQIYLRYQDIHRNVTFQIDGSTMARNGLTRYSSPQETTTFTSTSTELLCVQTYSDSAGYRIAVGVGQCFGQHWIHVAGKEHASEQSWQDFKQSQYKHMLARGPELARSMTETRYQDDRDGRVWVKHFCLPGSIWTIRTSSIVWDGLLNHGVMIEAFRHPYTGPDTWIGITVERPGTNNLNCDMRDLMIPHWATYTYTLLVDGVPMYFSQAPEGIKVSAHTFPTLVKLLQAQLGDYGYFTADKVFHREGNTSAIIPKRHNISHEYESNTNDYAKRYFGPELYEPVGLSFEINDDAKSWLDRHSTELTNKYLVTVVIQCPTMPSTPTSGPTIPLCAFRKPFVWYQYEGFGSAVGKVSKRRVKN
ncbi:heterokaryon incompatibility protein-domain-containing protein [Scleroderma yunnanense]